MTKMLWDKDLIDCSWKDMWKSEREFLMLFRQTITGSASHMTRSDG